MSSPHEWMVLRMRSCRALLSLLVALTGALLLASSASAAPAGSVSEFAVPTASADPFDIAAGPDGTMWFTEPFVNQIGRISVGGAVTEFPTPAAGSQPTGIAMGPDGNMWFTEAFADQIGRITPTGAITEFPIPTAQSSPGAITAGPDGAMWFAERAASKIGRITSDGTVTEFRTPTGASGPDAITSAPDGNLWFTEFDANKIGRITPAGTITEFATPTAGAEPAGIALGADGNLWFTELDANKIGRITLSGAITEFPAGPGLPLQIAAGPDGSMWFTQDPSDEIGRITPTGAISNFPVTTANSTPQGIAAGADGSMWFTEESAGNIAEIGTAARAASLRAPSASGSGEQGTLHVCEGDVWSPWGGQLPSYGEFSFDGYQWLRDGVPIAGQTAQTYVPSANDVGHSIACRATVTYPLLAVTESAQSGSVSVTPPLVGPQGPSSVGPAGNPGAPGADGEVELVSCRTVTRTVTKQVHGKPRKVKVSHQVCTTKIVSGPVKFMVAAANARASLARGGVVRASGDAHVTSIGVRVALVAPGRLAPGRYALTVTRRAAHRNSVLRYHVVLRAAGPAQRQPRRRLARRAAIDIEGAVG
jgi:streptogramin lyase